VENAIHLALIGVFSGMRVDRRICRLSCGRIRDPHTSNTGRHLFHSANVQWKTNSLEGAGRASTKCPATVLMFLIVFSLSDDF
jgi:hypothetical protein